MIRKMAGVVLAAAIVALCADAQAGFLSSIRDKIKDGGAPQHQAGEQIQPQATPPPAEKAAQKKAGGAQKPAKTPTPEQVKERAKKLEKELNWDKIPSDLFQQYAGTWVGHFWTYTPLGRKEQVSKVKITYEPQGGGTMKMTTLSFDLISKQYVTEETAVYKTDGDTVNVEIKRPTGKISRQVGHYADGQIFFKSKIDDGVEHFRERIDGKRLLIDGFGVYKSIKSDDQHVFIGRFQKEEKEQ